MEEQNDAQLTDYRQHLLEALHKRLQGQCGEESEELQVFVNQMSVGTLAGESGIGKLVYKSSQQPIHSLEIRTASGALIGSLCTESGSSKIAQFALGPHRVEVNIENRASGGVVTLVQQLALTRARGLRGAMKSLIAAMASVGRPRHPAEESPVPALAGPANQVPLRALLVSQVILVLAVIGLVADHLVDHIVPRRDQTQMEQGLARQETVLSKLAQEQEATTKAIKNQRSLIRHAEEQLSSQVATLAGQISEVKLFQAQARQEMENRLLAELSRAAGDRERLGEQQQKLASASEGMRGQIQSLAATQEAMRKDVGTLEMRVMVADLKGKYLTQPVRLWVSFAEGTPEASVEKLVQEIHGRRSPMESGWYPIEVDLPEQKTPDAFIEVLRKYPMVKAIRTSLNPMEDP